MAALTTHPVQLLLDGHVNGGALVKDEEGSGAIGVVGGKGDTHTNQVPSLLNLHRAAALRGLKLE